MRTRTKIIASLLGLVLISDAVRGDEPGLSRAEFDKLHKELNLKNQPWATIPWKVTLTEARELAVKSKKPIFMVVNTGNCLGFV